MIIRSVTPPKYLSELLGPELDCCKEMPYCLCCSGTENTAPMSDMQQQNVLVRSDGV